MAHQEKLLQVSTSPGMVCTYVITSATLQHENGHRTTPPFTAIPPAHAPIPASYRIRFLRRTFLFKSHLTDRPLSQVLTTPPPPTMVLHETRHLVINTPIDPLKLPHNPSPPITIIILAYCHITSYICVHNRHTMFLTCFIP